MKRNILIALLIVGLLTVVAYTAYPTHFTMLRVSANPNTVTNTLTDGQVEIGDNLYVLGDLTTTGGAVFNGTVSGNLSAGSNAFISTNVRDTVAIAGITSATLFAITILDSTPVANDLLSYEATAGLLFVWRPAGTTSALEYTWIRLN